MKTELLKRIRIERYILAAIMITIMFLIADFTGQKEIIFPEILAIMTGAWISERQPWLVNKRKMFLLIALSSIIGVCTVKYVHTALFFQVLISFVFTGIALILTRTTFIPIISAVILPIYLHTDSWIYAIAVTFMAVLIVLTQWLMEKFHLRPKNHYEVVEFNLKEEIQRWIKLFAIFAIISVIPLESRNIFFLAPPLIVTFAEFANPKSPLRKVALKVYFIMIFAATVGSMLRLVFELYLNVPLVIAAILACLCLFILFDKVHILFPPAGAILLLPMVITKGDLIYFPLEVLIGASIIIPTAIFFFKKKTA